MTTLPFETELGASNVEGVRLFNINLDKLELHSVGVNHVWLPGVIQESQCHFNRHKNVHLKPEVDCTCGIWACKSRSGLRRTFPLGPTLQPEARWGYDSFYGTQPIRPLTVEMLPLQFSARVKLWGVVIEHKWGYRAEYAQLIPESLQLWPRGRERHKKLVPLLRAKYGAPHA